MSITVTPRRPLVAGHLISLGCANPANARITEEVRPADQPAYGGRLRCFAQALSPHGRFGPEVMSGPTGLGPTEIQSAYKLAGLDAAGRTVAVVDAYNDPKAASDLATYRSQYGLPPCTVANGCFGQVNQSGAAGPLPSDDAGWAEEESLAAAARGTSPSRPGSWTPAAPGGRSPTCRPTPTRAPGWRSMTPTTHAGRALSATR